MPGTFFLSLAEAKKRFEKAEGLDSLYGSSKVADEFNVANKVYAESQAIDEYIDPRDHQGAMSTPRTSRCRQARLVRRAQGSAAAQQRQAGAVGIRDSSRGVVRGELRAVRLAPAGTRAGAGRGGLLPARHAGRACRVRRRKRRRWRLPARRRRRANAPIRSICRRHIASRARSYTAFLTPPRLPTEPWLHQSMWQSIQLIFWGFVLSSVIGVPLGIAVRNVQRAVEADRAVHRVLPLFAGARVRRARGRGARASTTRRRSRSSSSARSFSRCWWWRTPRASWSCRCIEAAQTLGASKRQLVFKVVVPGVIVDLYTDMRVLLGWAWTYLIVAEMVGTTSGITYFINQQARYRNYDNVYAAIMLIGFDRARRRSDAGAPGSQLVPVAAGEPRVAS